MRKLICALGGTAALGLFVFAPALWPSPRRSREDGAAVRVGSTTVGAIDRYIRSEMRRARIPGVAVAVVRGGNTVFARGFGTTGRGTPVTAASRFRLGSTTKSITALAVVQLAERGEVDLDAPVSHYLPWFRLADEAKSRTITLRHLAMHTSGISTGTGFQSFRNDGGETLESRVRALRGSALANEPGRTFQYSNANYEILGAVIEAVSGQRYDDYLRDHVFSPLGMRDTSGGGDQSRVVRGYQSWFGLPRQASVPYLQANGPAGQVVSTAGDLARYLQFQLSGRADPGPGPISPDGLGQLHRPGPRVHAPSFVIPPHQRYGMGWYVGPLSGERAVWHSGDVFNYSSELVLLPARDLGVVVLANESFLPVEPADHLGRALTALIAGQRPPRAGLRAEVATLAIDLLLAGFLWLVIAELVDVIRGRGAAGGRLRHGVRVVGVDLVLPSVLLLAVRAGGQGSFKVAWRGLPDVTAVVVAGSGLLLACGAVRAVRWRPWRPGRKHSPAAL